MKTIRARLGFDADKEGGLTLVEVIVAMMIFGMVAIGIAYSLASTLNLTRDSRSIAVASNLAAQVIDKSRSIENVFAVLDDDYTIPVDGVDYYVSLRTGWVTATNASAQCGASGTSTANGSLEYKRVNVSVKWKGMRANATPVRSDTLIAPNSRINDPSLGTILVSVLNANGGGSAGINVSAVRAPISGNPAITPAEASLPTDTQGCSYILKVTPGKYNVTISRAGYVDVDQNVGSVTTLVEAKAGQSSSVGFQFDAPGKISPQYAPGIPSPLLGSDLQTTYLSTYGIVQKPKGQVGLHPFPSGYQVLAGNYVEPNATTGLGCLSPDPAAWSTPRNDGAIGVRESAVIAPAGNTVAAQVGVPMGIVSLKNLQNKPIRAVSVASAPGTGDPGCAVQYEVNFTAPNSNGNFNLALPFGTWKLYTGNTPILGTVLDLLGVPIGTPAATTVTLDPRKVQP